MTTNTRRSRTSRLDRIVAGTAAAVFVGTLLAAGPVLQASAGEPRQQAPTMTPFIVGGEDADRSEYAGFMVSLQVKDDKGKWAHLCGASVLSRYEVLTAAHCVEDMPAADPDSKVVPDVRVVVGASTVPNGRAGDKVQAKAVRDVVVHPGYEHADSGVDAAVLKLDQPFDHTVTPVRLPTKGTDALLAPGAEATVIGWGDTSFGGQSSTTLKKVTVPIVGDDECEIAYSGFERGTSFCAGVTGKDSCQGDSGGPLFRTLGTGADRRVYQIGIVSYGDGCAATGKPGVYASTSSTVLRDGLGIG